MGLSEGRASAAYYLDTNVFIAVVERYPEHDVQLHRLFGAVAIGQIPAVTSELTLLECLVKPLRDGDAALVAEFESFLASGGGLDVVPVNRAIVRRAARIRAEQGFRLPDAVHVATALEAGCQTFVTNDRRVRIEGLRVVSIDELSID